MVRCASYLRMRGWSLIVFAWKCACAFRVVAPGLLAIFVLAAAAPGDRLVEEELDPPAALDAFVQRTSSPPTLDGRLDDDVWRATDRLASFTQIDPEHGSPAQAVTDVRLLWDDDALYVAARMSDPPGEAGTRVEGMRRDFSYANTDVFGVGPRRVRGRSLRHGVSDESGRRAARPPHL